jgi:hypothetical protein
VFELLGGRHQLRRGPGNDAGQRACANTDICKAASVDFLQIPSVIPYRLSGSVYGALSRQRNNQKYGAATLSFPHSEGFLRKLSIICARVLSTVRQSCSRPKFKECRFEGASTCLGPALCTVTSLLALLYLQLHPHVAALLACGVWCGGMWCATVTVWCVV